MPIFEKSLQDDINRFHHRLLTDPAGVVDPKDVHHELVDGGHGRKINFDRIETGSVFYVDLIAVFTKAIIAVYPDRRPDALVGIANGANRLSQHIAPLLGERVLGLTTIKLGPKSVKLDEQARQAITENDIEFVLIEDDVATTGSSTMPVIAELQEAGIEQIEVAYACKRNPRLHHLDNSGVRYWAMFNEILPVYPADACKYCEDGVRLIPHGQ